MVIRILGTGLLLVALAGCGAGETARETVTVTAPESSSAVSLEESSRTWTMPNLIGENLQDAQDAIQELTDNEVFFSSSTDLTGKGRKQVLDRNWQVCTSTPLPGTSFDKDTRVDFGVVRIDSESCP